MTALKVISTKNLSRSEWLQWRMTGIGGSDISAILGFNKYKSAVSVWLEKIGQAVSTEENFKMEMGHRLESVVADMFAERNPDLKVRKNNYLLRHSKISCMLANIDREVICPKRGKGILEIKTTGDYNKKEWSTDRVPDMYMFQLQHYFAVTGYKFGFFACLIGGNTDYKSYYVERDETIIAHIESEAVKFWDKVQKKEQPELDGSDASMKALGVLYPSDEAQSQEIDLPIHLQDAFHEFLEIKKRMEADKERLKELQCKVVTELGNSAVGRLGSYYVTWKPQTSKRVDTELLKTEFPEIYEKVVRHSDSRPFKVGFKES